MRHEPTAANLLETARTVLREKILPQLPASARYEALMVANAMAIAARQIEAEDRPVREAQDRLAALYDDRSAPLPVLEARLVEDLRAGRFDAPSTLREAVFDHLWQTACARASESNPKACRQRW